MIKAIKGMNDILSPDVCIWQALERGARIELESSGYVEIRTPIVEDTAVFVRSIGETTDIVKKEMYTFTDRGDRSLTLRPEGTAPIVRAYIEHSLDKIAPDSKFYYIGPMFRSESPQKGRSRQFHQIGLEAFGSASVYADAEVIMQINNLLKQLGISGHTIKLNTLGCKTDKEKFTQALKKYLEDKEALLCSDCKDRLNKNVLRVLDCKKESCIGVVSKAPNILDSLCAPCVDHFNKLKSTLNALKVPFIESKNLVRGLDYYTGMVFEVIHPALGGQDAVGAGGRYDNLVKEMGGENIPAVGFALGIERLLIAFKKEVASSVSSTKIVYVATMGEGSKIHGIQLAEKIRRDQELEGSVIVVTDIKDASIKSQMRYADKIGATAVLIIGDDELAKKGVTLKRMKIKDAAQEFIKVDAVIQKIREILK